MHFEPHPEPTPGGAVRRATVGARGLNDELRFRVLRLLTQRPEISQRELAGQLGLSLGKANYCIRALIEKGWIKAENFQNSRNKLAYFYVLTPNGLRAKARATIAFLQRKQREYAELEREIDELRNEAARRSPAKSPRPGTAP